jgi:hypothetical protein
VICHLSTRKICLPNKPKSNANRQKKNKNHFYKAKTAQKPNQFNHFWTEKLSLLKFHVDIFSGLEVAGVSCPVCEKGELKFDREEDVLPPHHSLYSFRETTQEKIYVCSNCGFEFYEEVYKGKREMVRYRKSKTP